MSAKIGSVGTEGRIGAPRAGGDLQDPVTMSLLHQVSEAGGEGLSKLIELVKNLSRLDPILSDSQPVAGLYSSLINSKDRVILLDTKMH